MKSIASTRSAAAGGMSHRRGVLVGVGIVGIAAVAARALGGRTAEPPPAVGAKPRADQAGYRATAHVLRYYETANS